MPVFYTYLIGWSSLGLVYYGSRTSKHAHPSELMVKYKTSSTVVKRLIHSVGMPDLVQIRKQFSDKNACYAWETKVLRRMNAKTHANFLNLHNNEGVDPTQISTSHNAGFLPAVDSFGVTLQVHRTDPRFVSGELSHVTKGTTMVDDNGVIKRVSIDHPDFLSGKLKYPSSMVRRGSKNGFFGKHHSTATKEKAVATRLKNGNGVYTQNYTLSDVGRETIRAKMRLNNPMFDKDILKRSSEKSTKTRSSYEFWYKTFFIPRVGDMADDIISFVSSNIDTIIPSKVASKYDLKIDFSRSIIQKLTQRIVIVDSKEDAPYASRN